MAKSEVKVKGTTVVSAKKKQTKEKATDSSNEIKALESAYRAALAAFKSDKTDKDLRRCKSAAKKAWDAARLLAATQDGGETEQLSCKDCSQMFLFTAEEVGYYAENGWDHRPTRCAGCVEGKNARQDDREKRDGRKENMCYSFQRGECGYGERCKFSHNPEHAGKRKDDVSKRIGFLPIGVCYAFQKGECKKGDKCRFSHALPKAAAAAAACE